jgi:hypothetical protein
VDGVLLFGFMVGSSSGGAFNSSHILFVDDTFIFCEANSDYLHNLHSLFLCFEAVAKFIWDDIIEKVECHLAGWEMMYLSKG